ncbi:FtsX-like permease family protein [Radiobacillus sp. PE A8.2]|uniref:FtsX-like permease family protein n=1 Tax=Radiobacillus sp. PE A8.2 TaxID=3380349 RepID=UPI0038911096
MFSIIAQSIRNQKKLSFLYVLAIAIILFTIPLTMNTLQTATIKVQSAIEDHARGTYDILVRPKGAANQVEQKLGLVEENYLAVGNGGISIAEWNEIKRIADVDVAAPIASLGYFTGKSKTFSIWNPTESVRVNNHFYTTNGVNRYNIKTVSAAMIEREPGLFDKMAEGRNKNYMQPGVNPAFLFPNTYHLLVGIDPESEEKLTNISFDQLNVELSTRQLEKLSFAGDAPIIKVLKFKDAQVPLFVNIDYDTIEVTSEQLSEIREELDIELDEPFFLGSTEATRQVLANIQSYPASEEKTYHYNFSNYIEPFSYDFIYVNKEEQIIVDKEQGGWSNQGETSMFYQTSEIPYEIDPSRNRLAVTIQGVHEGVPTYREVTERGVTFTESTGELPFVLETVGDYTMVDRQKEIASSPLGIYQLRNPTLVENEQGKITDIEMTPTITPGSFVPSPAQGVVLLEDTEIIKGEKPIDAIRVRVAGIDGYTIKTADKVKQVAGEIAKLGYQVDIVAGASPQYLEVEVEGLGIVKESWTTLGASASIQNRWNGTTILLSIVFSLVSLTYLFNRMYLWKVNKRGQIILLQQLGWDKKHISLLFQIEVTLLLLLAGIVSLLGLWATHDPLANTSLTYSIYAFLLCIVFFISIWHIRVSNRKKTGRIRKHKTIDGSSFSRLIQSNVHFYLPYLRPCVLQLLFVSFLTTFAYLSIKETTNQTGVTLLGEFINNQIFIMQLIVMLAGYTIAIITITDTTETLLSLRRREVGILRAVGWDAKQIIDIFFYEMALWTGFATLVGIILCVVSYSLIYPITYGSLVIALISWLSLYFIILVTCYSIIRRILNTELSSSFVLRRGD